MKHSKIMLTISMLFSVTCLQAVSPGTIAKLEKERKEEESKQTMPELLAKLPPDLRREILNINAQSEVLNIPAIAQGLTTLAATSKGLHAAINNPGNMLTILKSLPRAGAVVLANGLKKMPGMKSNEVQNWLKKLTLDDKAGEELFTELDVENPNESNIARILAKPNVDVNWKYINDDTALIVASKHGLTNIVKQLLKLGADVNAKNADGRTALMEANHHGHVAIIKELLAAGANINVKDNDQWSALMFASQYGNTEIVKILLAANADYSIESLSGKSAKSIARECEHVAVVKVLEDAEKEQKAQKEKAARK